MSSSRNYKVISFVACLCLIAAVISFFCISNMLNRNQVLAEENREAVIKQVSTIEEASKVAGYQVVTPAAMPEDYSHIITVFKDKLYPANVVQQIWNYDEKSFICLVQDPVLDGISGGEKTDIFGFTGERLLLKAESHRPAVLVLYWQDDDMSYLLYGTLTESINEEILNSMTSSVVNYK